MADVLTVLAEVGRGRGLEEMRREFNAIMDAVRENGGKGELIIRLQLEGKAWDHDTRSLTEVVVKHEVASKRPRRKTGGSTYFVTGDGELTRNDPKQMEMYEEVRHAG